jgi:hypothetical protein
MAVSVIQGLQASQSAAQTPYPTAGLSITASAGSYLYVLTEQNQNNNGISLPTDPTNTYVQLGTTLNLSTGAQLAQFVTNAAVSGGTYVVKSNYTGSSTFPAMAVIEIGGSSGPDLGATGFASNFQSSVATGTDAVTTTNLTPSVANGMIIGVTVDSNLSHAFAAGTGFTDLTSIFGGSTFWQFTTGANRALLEFKLYSTTAALAATWTLATGSTSTGSVAALFAQSSGGGSNTASIAWVS